MKMKEHKFIIVLSSSTNPNLNYNYEFVLNKPRISFKDLLYIFQGAKDDAVQIKLTCLDSKD
jgi:hypothetical protein